MALHNDVQLYQAGSGVELNTNTYINNTAPINITGSINVTSVGGDATNTYGTASAVPSAIETTVVSYLVPVGKIFKFEFGIGSANADADFFIKVGAAYHARKRNAWTERNVFFNFILNVAAGQTIYIKVLHQRPTTQNFYANISGTLIDV